MNQADDDRAQALSRLMRGFLAGQGPGIQGAVLADLMSLWLAGHNPALREAFFTDWIDTVRKLVPVSEKEIFGEAGFPDQLQ